MALKGRCEVMEDFVHFEISKKLKEKGFPQSPDYFNYSNYYDWDGLRKIHSLSNESAWYDPNISRDNIYFAPTISQVLEWMRKEKGIHVCITLGEFSDWVYDVSRIDGNMFCKAEDGFKSYEQAALAGVNYCLDNLI